MGRLVAERFEIERLAGAGGMGAVYRARDRLDGRPVALKLLLAGQGDETAERFVREGRILAELDHPAIVRYVAHGRTSEGELYLAMEWLEGQDLSAHLADCARRGARLTIEQSVAVVQRAAEGLAAAHERGVVHRDIKPSNLLLAEGDLTRLKLADFGIARTAHTTIATLTGAVLGTPAYMAPEQVRGDRALDVRVDVFALGCVFYECLIGAPPFVGEHVMAVLAKILLEDAPRVRALRKDVPNMLDELIAHMLTKDLAGRTGGMSEVLRELERFDRARHHGASHTESSPRVPPKPLSQEQHTFSVIVVGVGAPPSSSPPDALAETIAVGPPLSAVVECVSAFSGRVESTVDGSIFITLATGATATDGAARAARCALAVRRIERTAPMVLATGRGSSVDGRAIGEVIDRAASLFSTHSTANGRAPRIRLDAVTAGLLGAQFIVRSSPDPSTGEAAPALELVEEAEHFEEARMLLGKPTRCFGRERDLNALSGFLEECLAESQARLVVVTALPGVGKSRLGFDFVRRARQHPGLEVWFARADPMRAGAPFSLVSALIRRVTGIAEGDALDVRQGKLRARVGRCVDQELVARCSAFLGEIVGTPFAEDSCSGLGAARRDPKAMAGQIRLAWERWVHAEAAAHPTLILLEDLHWADRLSVELIDAACSLRDCPLLVLALARPEVRELFPALLGARQTQELRLSDLGRRAAEALVRDVLGDDVDAETVARIVERAAGNAFYLEELIRAVAAGRRTTLPETVLVMVQARLAALPAEARKVLRAGSLFGDVFWRGAVLDVLGADRGSHGVDECLADLVTQEVLTVHHESRIVGEGEYAFRHALLRDGAYAMLTDEDRALGHRLAGIWLERAGETEGTVLAEHFEHGGELNRALHFRIVAARDCATKRGAPREALGHVEQGASLLHRLPDSPRRDELELALQIVRGSVLSFTEGHASKEMGRAYARARELCEQLGESATLQLPSVLVGLWINSFLRGELRVARQVSEELLAMAERSNDAVFLYQAHRTHGSSLLWSGELRAALHHNDLSLAFYNPEEHRALALLDGYEPRVFCLVFSAMAIWCLGYPEQARARNAEAFALAKSLGHGFTWTFGIEFASWMHILLREPEPVLPWSETLMALAIEHESPHIHIVGRALHGWAFAERGQLEGLEELRQAISDRKAAGTVGAGSLFELCLAEACQKAGRVDEALSVADLELSRVLESGEHYLEAELYRIRGECLRMSKRATDAEDCFQQALEVARRLGAKMLELRAAVSLSQLYEEQGRRDDARDVLHAVYSWFTEGHDTHDLRTARRQLESLG